MTWKFLFKAGAVWAFGAALVLLGTLPVLYFLGLVAWQGFTLLAEGIWVSLPAKLWFVDHAQVKGPQVAAVLQFIPAYPSQWVMDPDRWLPLHQAATWILNKLHAGIVFAAFGAYLILMGARIALPQMTAFAAEKRRKEDRRRRRDEYRRAHALEGSSASPQRVEPTLSSRRLEPSLAPHSEGPRTAAVFRKAEGRTRSG